ncbi:putative uncharacterized protein [Waddlia chondrophila 2032/99]|uniref:Raffinose synthase n=1 Tax=Waddlia chondrophila 2032/99 TaxID=765953 RepID=F8LF80_9BACT|nr:putative uncharacterized protein [Waddlia chondrophila 2032/99]
MMKTLQADTVVDLDRHLASSQLVIVTSPLFSGSLRIPLKLESADNLTIVSIGNGSRGACLDYFTCFHEITSNFLTIVKCRSGYNVLCCLSHSGVAASLEGDGKDCLLCLRGVSAEPVPVLIGVHGSDLHQTVGLAIRMGVKKALRAGKFGEEKPPIPHWLKTLGWESGASFGRIPTHDKILGAVWALRQEGIQPGYVLIDEGWQRVERRGGKKVLSCFEADAERFPMGLSGLVQELQRAGVHHVGVAHSIFGCGGGISDSLVGKYQLSTKENEKGYLGYDLGKTFQFYHDYYKSLSGEGIAFVKVKRQVDAAGFIGNPGLMTRIYSHLQSAIQASSGLFFEAPHLNSECLNNESLISGIAATDDDLETAQTLAGVKKTIRSLLVNACWMQNFFSSWITDFPYSHLLAILHALSSTAHVIGDPPGKTKIELLKKCVLPSGRLIQADHPLILCSSSFFLNPLTTHALYCAFSFKGESGLLALFNFTRKKKPLQEDVSASLIEGISGDRFAVYSHTNGYLGVFEKNEEFSVAVKQNEADILTFAPVRNGVALIGCYAFYVPNGPIQEITIEQESMHISSIVTSPMLMYSEKSVMEIRRNGKVIPWDYDQEKKLLVIDSRQSQSEIPTVYTLNFE